MDEICFQIRNIIVQEFSRVIASAGIPVLDMAANTADLGKLLAERIAPALAAYGLELPELYIENISLPEAVEAAMDKRTSMGVAGDLGRYMPVFGGRGDDRGGEEPRRRGPGDGDGGRHGDGRHGRALGRRRRRRRAPPPPPPPVEKVWHIAENGQTKGPFGRGHLGRMVAEGSLTRETLVWAQGQDGWKPAGEIADLAQLFTVMPPPPPPAA